MKQDIVASLLFCSCEDIDMVMAGADLTDLERTELDNVYLDPGAAGGFSSLDKLFRVIKKTLPALTRKKVEDYLLEKESYYLHKPAPRRSKNVNKFMTAKSNQILCVDLIDLTELADSNNGYKYILVGVDLFSRFAYGVPMKTKHCKSSTIPALKHMFSDTDSIPFGGIYSDRGGEFICKELKAYLKSQGIRIYFANNMVKVGLVERFILTFRLRLERFLESNQTRKYIDVLQNLFTSYNNTYHRSIGRAPSAVNEDNTREVYQFQYLPFKPTDDIVSKSLAKKQRKKKPAAFRFAVGDTVRVSSPKKNLFTKESRRSRWTVEVFKIVSRTMRYGIPVYKLVDLHDEPVVGTWYQRELTKAFYNPDGYFKLDPTHKIKERTRRGHKEYYVAFEGYPKKFNLWLSDTEFKNLQQ